MSKKQKNPILNVLEYDASRKYFGDFTYNMLYEVYHMFKHSQKHDKPITAQRIKVGHIDGEVICRALLKQMSYNPKRFGTVSPFRHNGRENIFRFCDTELSTSAPGYDVLVEVQKLLRKFLFSNSKSNRQWFDEIRTGDGYLTISFDNMYSDKNYKKLTMLRDALQKIINQNVADFNLPEYRAEMVRVIVPQEEISHDSEEERVQYEIEEIWRKTNGRVLLTAEELNNREVAEQAKKYGMPGLIVIKQNGRCH